MSYMNTPAGTLVELLGRGSRPRQVHVFSSQEIDAVDAALAAQRPLLVRGEPGIGKSQLARAVAKHLGRVYVPHVVNAHTEPNDLLWRFDAVARLADAQLSGTLGAQAKSLHRHLAVRHYLHPGPLWWGFDWADALRQAAKVGGSPPPQDDDPDAPRKPNPSNGCVVLIDEIDKAEPDVPNGLLEALGAGEFTPIGRKYPVVAHKKIPPPLVVITTNEERALPDAFLRRCLVLHLALPKGEEPLKRFLRERGRAHFEDADPVVLCEAAEQLVKDRKQAEEDRHFPLPGQAEYLDLIRALITLEPGDPEAQGRMLSKLAAYAFCKHPGARR